MRLFLLKAGEYFGRLVVLLLDFQGGDGITSWVVLLVAVCPVLHLLVLAGLWRTTQHKHASSHPHLVLPGSLFPSDSYTELLYAFDLFTMHTTDPVHLIPFTG